MVICLERGADLHMAQLMPLPLTVFCFSKIQIGFTFLVPAHPGSPGKGPLNRCDLKRDTKAGSAGFIFFPRRLFPSARARESSVTQPSVGASRRIWRHHHRGDGFAGRRYLRVGDVSCKFDEAARPSLASLPVRRTAGA